MNKDNETKTDIVDLLDFYEKWPRYKKHAIRLKDNPKLDKQEKEILHWLIKLANRVGKSDIEPLK